VSLSRGPTETGITESRLQAALNRVMLSSVRFYWGVCEGD